MKRGKAVRRRLHLGRVKLLRVDLDVRAVADQHRGDPVAPEFLVERHRADLVEHECDRNGGFRGAGIGVQKRQVSARGIPAHGQFRGVILLILQLFPDRSDARRDLVEHGLDRDVRVLVRDQRIIHGGRDAAVFRVVFAGVRDVAAFPLGPGSAVDQQQERRVRLRIEVFRQVQVVFVCLFLAVGQPVEHASVVRAPRFRVAALFQVPLQDEPGEAAARAEYEVERDQRPDQNPPNFPAGQLHDGAFRFEIMGGEKNQLCPSFVRSS